MRAKLFVLIMLGQVAVLFFIMVGGELGVYRESLLVLKKNDVSIQENVPCNNDKSIWLVSFAHGDVYTSNQRALVNSSLNRCVQHSLRYSKKDIDNSYYIKHKNILDESRGAGYWLWKPYFILKSLELMPENDYLLYVDSGVVIRKPVDKLIQEFSGNNIILFENYHANERYIKRELLQYFDFDNDLIRSRPQLIGTFLFIKNNELSRRFIREWLRISEHKNLIDDSKSNNEYEDFADHRHDQAILSLLYYKNPTGIKILPFKMHDRFFIMHKRRCANKTLLFAEEEFFGKRLSVIHEKIAERISNN